MVQSHFDRRSFLQTAVGAGAAALTAGSVFKILAAETKATPPLKILV